MRPPIEDLMKIRVCVKLGNSQEAMEWGTRDKNGWVVLSQRTGVTTHRGQRVADNLVFWYPWVDIATFTLTPVDLAKSTAVLFAYLRADREAYRSTGVQRFQYLIGKTRADRGWMRDDNPELVSVEEDGTRVVSRGSFGG